MHAPDETIGGTSPVRVRRMSASDVPAALAVLQESPEASIWSNESLLESVAHGNGWAAELDGSFAGFLIGQVAGDEFEILNLAVGKACRRQGVGTQLVSAALEYALTADAPEAYLEVRASNEGGIAFYTRLGFLACGRRTNYYGDPVEDAVLLVFHNRTMAQ
jgi:ribosomal-protein-alanine N-acetyltransferase